MYVQAKGRVELSTAEAHKLVRTKAIHVAAVVAGCMLTTYMFGYISTMGITGFMLSIGTIPILLMFAVIM